MAPQPQTPAQRTQPTMVVLEKTHWQRINAKVASHVFSLHASVEGTTVCLEIPLQPPPPPPGDRHLATVSPPPKPPGRPSRANPGGYAMEWVVT